METPSGSGGRFDVLKSALLLIVATGFVLMVVSSPVTAEFTGRATDHRELVQARKDLLEAEAEIKRLRERQDQFEGWVRDQSTKTGYFMAQIALDMKEVKSSFKDARWVADWIRASGKK